MSPVHTLALIYTEPVTDHAAAISVGNQREHGLAMPFTAHIKPVPFAPVRVRDLMRKAVGTCRAGQPPRSAQGCRECARVQEIMDLLGRGPLDDPGDGT